MINFILKMYKTLWFSLAKLHNCVFNLHSNSCDRPKTWEINYFARGGESIDKWKKI